MKDSDQYLGFSILVARVLEHFIWGALIAYAISAPFRLSAYNHDKTNESSVEIHRMWTDALTRSVETVCDRFLVLEVDSENILVEVQK